MIKKRKKLGAILLGAILALGVGAGLGAGRVETGKADYTKLTDVSTITSSKRYVLGIEGEGFHYSGTSNWGLTSITETPYEYELSIIDASAKTFTAKTNVSGTYQYLTIPTSNTFTMSTSSTTLKLGSNTHSTDSGTIKNSTTDDRHLRRNGSSGLRSYAGTTGTVAFFYEIGGGSGGDPVPATSVNVTAAGNATTVGIGRTLQLNASVLPSSADQTVTWSSSNNSFATVNSTTGLVTGVAEGNVTITATSTTPSISGTISLGVIVSSEADTYTAEIKKANTTAYNTNFTDGDVLEIGTGNGNISVTNGGTATIITTFHKNSSTTLNIMNNGAGEMRLYPGTTNGGEIRLSIAGEFVFSKVALTMGTNGGTAINGTAVTGTSPELVLSPTSDMVSIKNIANATSGSANRVDIKTITVEYEETAPAKALTSIAVTTQPTKTNYFAGDIFDGSGMVVKAYFDDESSETITPVLPTTPLVAGQTSVQISYTFGGVTETTNVPVTVSNRSITGLQVTTNPTKMTYRVGEVFDPTGMVVKATYDLGPTVDDYKNYILIPSGAFDTVGEQAVAIISTDDAAVSTLLDVNVLEALAGGTYTIAPNSTVYANPMVVSGLDIDKSESSMGNLSFSSIDNVRLNSLPNDSGTIAIGGNSTTGGKFTITLPSGFIATAITFNGLIVDSGKTPTLTINSGVGFTHSGKTSETLYPYANSLEISTLGTSRIWTTSIEITAAFNAAIAAQSFGTLFLEKTSAECTSKNVTTATWNAMEVIYDNADANVKALIQLGEPNVSGNELEQAIARYVYIVNKYAYVDFIGIVNPSGAKSVLFEMNDNNTIMLIVIVSLISVSALGGVFYFRKREQN